MPLEDAEGIDLALVQFSLLRFILTEPQAIDSAAVRAIDPIKSPFVLIELFLNAAQYYFGKIACGLFVRYVEQTAFLVPQNIIQRVMYQHS